MARLLLLLLVSLRGNVFLYQGEELGLPQAEVPFDRLRDPEALANWPETLGRDGARTPMPWASEQPFAGFSTVEPWLPIDPRHVDMSVDKEEADPGSPLHAARRLIALRKAHPALARGDLAPLDAPAPLVAFERVLDGERLTCVFNLGREAVAWPLTAEMRVVAQVNLDGPPNGILPPLAALVLASETRPD
jgi:alpha-glucosidase